MVTPIILKQPPCIIFSVDNPKATPVIFTKLAHCTLCVKQLTVMDSLQQSPCVTVCFKCLPATPRVIRQPPWITVCVKHPTVTQALYNSHYVSLSAPSVSLLHLYSSQQLLCPCHVPHADIWCHNTCFKFLLMSSSSKLHLDSSQ